MIGSRQQQGHRVSRRDVRLSHTSQVAAAPDQLRGRAVTGLRHLALIGAVAVGLVFAHTASGDAKPELARAAARSLPATPAQSVTALDGRLSPLQSDSPRGLILLETQQAIQLEARLLVTATAQPARLASSAPSTQSSVPAASVPTSTPTPSTPARADTAVAITAVDATAAIVAARATEPAVARPVAAAVAAPTAANQRYASRADVITALARTRWAPEHWGTVVAIAFCESGMDTNRDGVSDVVDTQASGASGAYVGVLQIAPDHRFSAPYDLRTLAGNLDAGYELWLDNGRSFAPWGCR